MAAIIEVFQRDDGRFQISLADDAGSFETRERDGLVTRGCRPELCNPAAAQSNNERTIHHGHLTRLPLPTPAR
jgi:hypothetical protein